MATRTVLEGNAFYEIDEECMAQKNRRKNGNQAGDNSSAPAHPHESGAAKAAKIPAPCQSDSNFILEISQSIIIE